MESNINNIQKSTSQEFTIPEKQMAGYKQMFEKESLQKKKQYLLAIKEHNQQLLAKIKEFDNKVNLEVNSLSKKIVPKKKTIIPKFQEIETKPLREKFDELQKYKRQLQMKRSSTNSLQFLLTVKKKFEIKLAELAKQIFNMKRQIHQLKKIKDKTIKADENEKNELSKLGDLDIYSNEIENLRMQVREKSENLRTKKDQFLSLYKQNRSNKSIIVQSAPKEEQIKQQDPQLAKLKQQYEILGNRVNTLKLKKSNLISQINSEAQNIKRLQKIKAKFQSLSKTSI